MMRLFVLLMFGVFSFSTLFAQSATSSYIRDYKILANTYSKEYGIPASVIMGVAIVESSSGKGRIVSLLNNHFGIVGSNEAEKTHGIKTRYKQYLSASASYKAFCKLLTRRKFYNKIKGNDNYKVWLSEISKTGYSTRPTEWLNKITGVITKYDL